MDAATDTDTSTDAPTTNSATAECVFQESSKLDFDYPLEGVESSKIASSGRRSAMKKNGQSRAGQQSSMMLKVHFHEVHLREYGMVMGDNPAVSHGAPVQLDWEAQTEHDPVHIENYEKARQLWRAKDRRGFLLNAHKRVKMYVPFCMLFIFNYLFFIYFSQPILSRLSLTLTPMTTVSLPRDIRLTKLPRPPWT